jgi:transcriptional regulator of acetoin/glycerol metabolism
VLAVEADDAGGAAIEAAALECLLAHDWPGNIRELRNVIRGALAICEGGRVRVRDLPEELQGDHAIGASPVLGDAMSTNRVATKADAARTAAADTAAVGTATATSSRLLEDSVPPLGGNRMATREALRVSMLARAERDTLLDAIRMSRGNLVRAARALGISRNTLYRKLRRHHIVVSRIDGLIVGEREPG